ncbi:hypothetical protein [Mycolicibacterium sp. J2]|jgi:hypothetical protein|nr:hypothetical protein [Mycolicibacterium sp. J2]MCX2714146.1 hypothetical protein [Mycolicibacterium sp. J2]
MLTITSGEVNPLRDTNDSPYRLDIGVSMESGAVSELCSGGAAAR